MRLLQDLLAMDVGDRRLRGGQQIKPAHGFGVHSFLHRVGLVLKFRELSHPHHAVASDDVRGRDLRVTMLAGVQLEQKLNQGPLQPRPPIGVKQETAARQFHSPLKIYQAKLLALSYEPIFVCDLEHRIVLWNQGCERLYGFTQAEAVGRVSYELLQTIFTVPFAQYSIALLHDQKWTGELRHTTRDGHEVIVESRQQWLKRDGRGLILKANRDITARIQTEAALRDSEARHHAVFQTAVDGIIIIDEHGMIASFNPAAERLFGYPTAAVLGQNVRMLMPEPYRQEHDGYLARYRQTGEPHIIGIGRDVRGQRRDGTTFPMALAVSEVLLDNRRMFTGIVHDLSARVEAEEALRHARDELEVRVKERTAELEAANEEIRRFAYIVSHDLRAPLVNLKGFSS